jgi:hypothetical protein
MASEVEIVDGQAGLQDVAQDDEVVGIEGDHGVGADLRGMIENIVEVVEEGVVELDHVAGPGPGGEAEDGVLAEIRTEDEGVIPGPAVERVVADAADQAVDAEAAEKDVVAARAPAPRKTFSMSSSSV